MSSIFNTGVNLVKEKVVRFDPDNNKFTTDIDEYSYDYLIVASGCQLRFDKIKGAKEALDDPDHPVVSIYKKEYAYKTLKFRESFKEGTAIFYQPPNPIKWGGAPKKITFLSEARWKELGVFDKIDIKYISALPEMFPPCKKYSIAINSLRQLRKISAELNHVLKAIDKDSQVAIFHDQNNDKEVRMEYDFLHIAPPQSAPDFISSSDLANSDGWVDADPGTLQHPKYSNVFSWGDASGVPTSKTAAAVFSQAPVIVHNLNKLVESNALNAFYDGYASCPLFVGNNKLMLAEFKYDKKPYETFTKHQDKWPSRAFYFMTKEMFPRIYFRLASKGKWYGRNTIFKPKF